MIHHLFSTSSCGWHTQGKCLWSKNLRNRLCAIAIVALVHYSGTNGGTGTAACGCNTGALIPTLPPSSSNAFGANTLPCASSKTSCHFIVRLVAAVLLFGLSPLHLQCQQVLYLIHPSVPSTFPAQIVIPQGPDGGWMAAKASTTLAHRTVPMEERRAFPHFFRVLSSRLDQPKTNGAWWHTAQAKSTDRCLLAPQHPKLTPPPA